MKQTNQTSNYQSFINYIQCSVVSQKITYCKWLNRKKYMRFVPFVLCDLTNMTIILVLSRDWANDPFHSYEQSSSSVIPY